MKQYSFKINGRTYDVNIESIEGSSAKLTVNGTAYQVELPATQSVPAPAAAPAAKPAEERVAQSAPSAPTAPTAEGPKGAASTIVSPMPGVIIDVSVTPGQAVKRGQKVAVLEAMKMENDILAESDGTVCSVFVKQGDSVLEGAKIVTIG